MTKSYIVEIIPVAEGANNPKAELVAALGLMSEDVVWRIQEPEEGFKSFAHDFVLGCLTISFIINLVGVIVYTFM